ncbi:MAG: V-type ATP synthase subunit E family protein [Chloroflexota bacterium]
MKSEQEDIDLLARAIMAEANDEAAHLLEEAKGKADAIRKRAQEQAESERKEILERAKQDAERLRSQTTATAQLKVRSTQLDEREKLLDGVFVEVKKQLEAVKKRGDYGAIATMLAREALTQLKVNQAEIHADEVTSKALNIAELSKELNGQFTLSEPLEEGIGITVSAAEGKLHYDNTLETRLSRLQGTLRSTVYKVLMGEQA